jgi:UDP-glucose 4-epimerase
MKILVTGGAGYIGSITSKRLLDLGHEVTIADSLEKGNRWAVDARATFSQGNLLDKQFVRGLFDDHFDGIIDFAGYIETGESVRNPGRYFMNNVCSVMNLLEAMPLSKSDHLIFSSSAAIYGNAKKIPITEDSEHLPTSPYGQSKLMVENLLKWYPIKYIALRYFNVGGAMPDCSLGQSYLPETHLIAIAIRKILDGEEFMLFGTDYDTPDGTCVRDYIHVLDLAEAHILALQALWDNKETSRAYNVGTGSGYSNKEVLAMIEKVSGKTMKIRAGGKREGDPMRLIADNSMIKKDLGFDPKYSDLETIIKTAYNWCVKTRELKIGGK